MRRRDLIAAGVAGVMATFDRSLAQQPAGKLPRVGILTPADNDKTAIFEAFIQGLRQLGYIDGQNIILEFRFARGDFSLLPQQAAELVALPVDVIVVDGPAAALIASKATRQIPIVMAAGPDPVELGLAASYSRPGGNFTGFTLVAGALAAKRLDLFHASFPDAAIVAILANSSNANATAYLRENEEAARSMGLRIAADIEVAGSEALLALTPTVLSEVAGVIVIPDPVFWNQRRSIVALVNAARLPAIYPEREYADVGGLMAYGPSVPDNFRRAADYVDRIRKGAAPADLPIQQPAKFDFVINQQTARTLGLRVPESILARADEVIE
jgi:putative tryptophan/tyrosine transport system substrate-binding protein